MLDRHKQEIELIKNKYGAVRADPQARWIIVKEWPLLHGWNKEKTAILVLVPPGYPVTPPDNFYTDNDLRLENEKQPSNTTPNHHQHGGLWLQFSYHVEKSDWKPHADILQGHNLLTFLAGVTKRLVEVS